MLSFLTVPVAKFAVFMALVLSLVVAGYTIVKQWDASITAENNLAATKAEAVEQAAHAQRTIATLQLENSQATADLAAASTIKRNIASAVNSSACAGSAPIGAALRGLQQPASGGPAAKGKPAARNVAVPAGAGAPVPGN